MDITEAIVILDNGREIKIEGALGRTDQACEKLTQIRELLRDTFTEITGHLVDEVIFPEWETDGR